MAVSIVRDNERVEIRPGDVVFSYNPKEGYPLHVGVYVGSERRVARDDEGDLIEIEVCGVPRDFHGCAMGTARWQEQDPIKMNEDYRFVISVVGQRMDVADESIEQVALLAKQVELEHSRQAILKWGWKPLRSAKTDPRWQTEGGRPIFTHGTCAQLVEFLYEELGLDLVDQQVTCRHHPEPDIHPATQMHAFWRGIYPLREPWQDLMGKYPDCLCHHERCLDR